jgi:hypothetical protein
MKASLALLALLSARCQRPTQKPDEVTMVNQQCSDSLRALADGNYDQWKGLIRCSRADADAALGPAVGTPSPGTFGVSRFHAARAAAPSGVEVWLRAHDEIVLVQINGARPRAPLDQLLGKAEAVIDSGLDPSFEQWVYASRGLTAHVQRWDHVPVRVYGYAPMTIGEFRDNPISQVWTAR